MERGELKAVVRATGCAVEKGEAVFLCAAGWSAEEKAQADIQITETDRAPAGERRGWLGVRTGGTGGAVKFARHDEETLGAAVRGFCAHFGLARVNAVDVLPPFHVSGLMARVRCAATGGRHCAWDWKQLEAGETPPLTDDAWVISLVPTQLQRLLERPRGREWLRQLRVIFVGGGPVWPELMDAAAEGGLRVALSYGMTETAAMVTALRPEEFLAGARSAGTPLPHAQVSITPEGLVRVAGESLFFGYWPEWDATRAFTTEDFGRLDERGQLHLHGRRDAMIITGGKKVQPADVEAALRASGEFEDVAVIGLPDREWGEVVVACYPAKAARQPNCARAVERLASFQRPKHFVALADWPRNAQGKVDRRALRAAVVVLLLRNR